MERHNRELRRREKLGTVWTERNLLALLQKQGLNNHPPKTKRYQRRQAVRRYWRSRPPTISSSRPQPEKYVDSESPAVSHRDAVKLVNSLLRLLNQRHYPRANKIRCGGIIGVMTITLHHNKMPGEFLD